MTGLSQIHSNTQMLPLQPEELYNVVAGAASQDPTVMRAASKRLEEVVKLPGTMASLHGIASQASFPPLIRHLAIIQCKNEMPGQWRHKKYWFINQSDIDINDVHV